MKRYIVLLILCMVIFSSCQNSSTVQEPVSDMQSDFADLYDLIVTRHPDVYAYTSEVDFAATYDELMEEIDEDLGFLDFYRLCVRLGALIGDGHVWVGMSNADIRAFETDAKLFPGIIRVIDGKYYLTARLDGGSEGIGAEILGINNRSIQDIRDSLMKCLTSDGNQAAPKDYMLFERGLFSKYYSLYLSSDQSKYTLELDGDDGLTMLTIEGVSLTELRAHINQNQAPAYQYELLAGDIAYLQIGSFAFYGASEGRSFKRFIDQTFEEINEFGVPNLIIDVRGNGGGDPYACVAVLNYIMPEDYTYFDQSMGYPDLNHSIEIYDDRYGGNVFILQDEGTFSSTGHFLSLVKEHEAAILVGQPSGATYTCNDNSQAFTLDHTKIRINLPTQTYTTTAQNLEKGRGIASDFVVDKNLEDILSGEDTALEYCLSLIRK